MGVGVRSQEVWGIHGIIGQRSLLEKLDKIEAIAFFKFKRTDCVLSEQINNIINLFEGFGEGMLFTLLGKPKFVIFDDDIYKLVLLTNYVSST